jgi:hypothetical protein
MLLKLRYLAVVSLCLLSKFLSAQSIVSDTGDGSGNLPRTLAALPEQKDGFESGVSRT